MVRKLDTSKHNITSRGEVDEHWQEVINLLHAEGHLEETICLQSKQNNTAAIPELAKELDETRWDRQMAVKEALISEKKYLDANRTCELYNDSTVKDISDLWCAIKHLLITQGHIMESMANASRKGDNSKVESLGERLNRVIERRERLLAMALCRIDDLMTEVYHELHSTPQRGCPRCADDLKETVTALKDAFRKK